MNGVKQGLITRINLDADPAHRVTLLATTDSSGAPINTIDGSSWDPWAGKLIFTTENENAPTYSATPDYPSTVIDISGAHRPRRLRGRLDRLRGQPVDPRGPQRRQQGRARPRRSRTASCSATSRDSPGDLSERKAPGAPGPEQRRRPADHVQTSQTPLNSPDQVALHIYGIVFDAHWVTIHDTAIDGHTPFNANTLAKAADGTPFKRPGERTSSVPGTDFREFYFDETGDTNATSPENDERGRLGARSSSSPRAGPSAPRAARLSIFYQLRRDACRLRQRGVPLA